MNHKNKFHPTHNEPFQQSLRRLLQAFSLVIFGFLFNPATATHANAQPYNISITWLANNSPADGVTQDAVQIVVTDATTHLPVNGVTVSFTIEPTTVSNNYTTGSGTWPAGTVQYGLSSTSVQTSLIDVKVNGVTITGSPLAFTYVAGPPSTANPNTRLIVDASVAPADGTTHTVIHAHVVDNFGNPVQGATVVFSTAGGTAAATANVTYVTTTTDANGNEIIDITNNFSGTVNFTATVNGNPIINGSPAQVLFTAITPDVTNPATKLIVDVATAPADGTTHTVIHAHIVDASGNPVQNATVVFAISGGSAAGTAIVSYVSATTDGFGNETIDITNTKTGTVIFTATVNGVGIINGSPATVTFTAGAPSVTNPATQLIVDVPVSPPDGTTADVIHAHIVDANGNVVPGATVVFTISGGTAAGTAVVSYVSPVTNANGDETINITNLKSGTVTFTATVNGIPIINGSPATVTFVATTPSGTNPLTMLVVDVTGSPADGTTADVIHAQIVDVNGNPVPNATVVFTINGGTAAGTATVTYVTTTTDANGDETIDITNTLAGTVSFTATVNGLPITNGSPAIVNFVAGAPSVSNPATQLIVDVTGSPADGATANIIHAHIVDANGNPVQGATVVFAISGGTASGTAVVTYVSATTDANGNETIDITDLKAGTVSFTATVNGTPIVNGSPATVTFASGVPSPTGGNTQLTIVVNNNSADGKSADSLNAYITDVNGNPVSGAVVTFTIEAGGTANGTAVFDETVTVTTDANGNAAIGLTNTVGGTVNVGAYVGAIAITGSPALVTFVNLPDVTNPQTQLIVVVYEALADGTATTVVKAHVVDQNGIQLPNQTVIFTVDSGSAQIVTPQPWTTDNNGDVSISLTCKTPGYALITATVGGKPITFGSPARVQFVTINIYVPRVFTPNGDGTNDILKPILVGISTFHYFSIYNRWGNLIFTTQDPNQGWDGTFRGVPQPVETYLWIAEGIDTNGKKIVQKGMVSLVR